MQTMAKPKGLAKIWREVKRPFRKMLGIRANLGQDVWDYQSYFLPNTYIRADGRVNLSRLEIYPVLGCNLRCQHCVLFSPYRKGFVSTEKILHWSETWSQKVSPVRLSLLGGEPFLHPDLATVILESHRIWNNSALEIISNGLLISKASQNVFDALRETKIQVIISDHSGVDLSSEKIATACARLEDNGISYELRPSNKEWYALHRFDASNIPISFQSSPDDAFNACGAKHCPAMINNRLYRCAVLASIIEGVDEGALSPLYWKDALTYTALSPDADADSILSHFRSGSINQCSVCPAERKLTEVRQISIQ